MASGFLRLVTHRKIFVHPTPTTEAVRFMDVGREWPELKRLCLAHKLTDNDIPDAWIAAAIKTIGGHLITFDKGFRRFLRRSELTLSRKLCYQCRSCNADLPGGLSSRCEALPTFPVR